MPGLHLKRHDGPLATLGAGEYAVDGTSLTVRCVFVSCPACAGIDEIAVDHGIDADGIVMPEFECRGALCSWSGLVTLDRWQP